MRGETLVEAELLSKKFCRSLRKSLWYGATDVVSTLLPWSNGHHTKEGDPVVPAETLPLRRDEFWAVQDVSFALKRGECLGLIGHNGAGKSTLLKILNGLLRPDNGQVTMRGRVAALIELNAGFAPILTGRENIYNQAALLGFTREETTEKFDQIVEFAEIGDFLDMPVQNYSSGMKVRLGFAVAAQMEPDILIIDEVLAVGDVAFRFKCLNAIAELQKTAAVIFVTHTMPQIFRICTEVIVLNHGKVTFKGENLSEGVALYMSLFKGADATLSGTGEAKVRDFHLDSSTASAPLGGTMRIPYGEGVTFRCRLSVDPGIEAVSVQFVLWNAEMLPVLDVMSDDLRGFSLAVPPSGVVDVSAHVPRVDLNAGKYSVSVMVNLPDYARALCRHDNVSYLQIEAAAASGAHALSVANWSSLEVGSAR